ncbi:hypothetical protein [Stenotrophomonas rhizophila]
MDNAVSRLLDLLLQGKQLPVSTQCMQNWKTLFNVTHDYEVPEKLGAMLVLAGDAARQVIELHPDCTDGVNYWRSRLATALTVSTFQSPWNEFFKYIDSHSISYLKMQAKLVNGERRTIPLDDSRLKSSRDALRMALDEIALSDLSAEAKLVLMDRVRSLIVAIENYAFFGQQAIFDLLKATAFDLGVLKEAGQDASESKSLREGLSILADLMTVASTIPVFGPPALALIHRITQ